MRAGFPRYGSKDRSNSIIHIETGPFGIERRRLMALKSRIEELRTDKTRPLLDAVIA
jgi:hypothetical protein